MTQLLSAVAILMLVVFAPADAAETLPPLWDLDPSPPQPLDPDELAVRVRHTDIVLVGEVHDNPSHHAAEAAVVRAAAADGRPLVVVFEMLGRDQQQAIDRYLASGGGAAGFGDAVAWEARGWPVVALYQPLFDAVFETGAAIVAADLPKAAIRAVGENGAKAAPHGLIDRFGLDRRLDPKTQATMLDIQDEAHCHLMPRDALAPMVDVQRLRDAAFADAVLAARAAHPGARVVLIAGKGHVRDDFGVGALLRRTANDAARLTIGLAELTPEVDEKSIAGEAGQYDVLWLTPPAGRPDPCENLRRRFSGGK